MLDNEDFEVLDPEYANFSGQVPLILSSNSLEEEVAYSIFYAKQYSEDNPEKKICIAFCGFSIYEICAFGSEIAIDVLDGAKSIGNNSIYLSDLEQTKGFEFDLICIINCNSKVMPSPYAPKNETFRDLARFYVAMTRSKSQLILSYSVDKSDYLDGAKNYFAEESWLNYIGEGPINHWQTKQASPYSI